MPYPCALYVGGKRFTETKLFWILKTNINIKLIFRKLSGHYHCSKCGWPLCGDRCRNTKIHQRECALFQVLCRLCSTYLIHLKTYKDISEPSILTGAWFKGPDIRFWKTEQNLWRRSTPSSSLPKVLGPESVQTGETLKLWTSNLKLFVPGVPADGPQGEPIAGAGEEAQPAGRADQDHLGLRQGLLCQRGQDRNRSQIYKNIIALLFKLLIGYLSRNVGPTFLSNPQKHEVIIKRESRGALWNLSSLRKFTYT